MDLKELKEILQILEEKEITEFELEEEGMKLRIRKASASGAAVAPVLVPAPQPLVVATAAAPAAVAPVVAAPAPPPPAAAEPDPGLVVVKSPIVGTFYRSASPDAEPFVSPGKEFDEGTVLCIIEAMKVMNEITAEMSGVVREILVKNGQAVEFGEPMFLIEKK